MKILYGIQGTGQGHISRARELLPEMRKYAAVDVLLSGNDGKDKFGKAVTYNMYGISFSYDRRGGISLFKTLCDFRPIRFVSDINNISIRDYDLVISDYEPISAWSAKRENIPCIGASHQASFFSPLVPRPKKKSFITEAILKHFAPVDHPIGFHFKRYDDFLYPPVIRSDIRQLEVSCKNHITVYLPAYHHNFLRTFFEQFNSVEWHIFSPACKRQERYRNIRIYPFSNRSFLKSFSSCRGIISNAGFETCSEAMYLGKKLLAIPIRNQYEQQCNAAALQELGVTTMERLDDNIAELWRWLEEATVIQLDEFADPEIVMRTILNSANLRN